MSSGHKAIFGSTCSFQRLSQAYENIIFPFRSARLFLSFFPPERYRVFCLCAQVSGKLRPSSINARNYQTKDGGAGPLLRLTHLGPGHKRQTKCVFPGSLEKQRVFWGKQAFLITVMSGWGNTKSVIIASERHGSKYCHSIITSQ